VELTAPQITVAYVLGDSWKAIACAFEKAQDIANHASSKTTKLYDRTSDQITLDEVERIVI
jgi:hypothetical protein